MTDLKYNAAYINALSEERDPKVLFEWVCKLHKENVDLRETIKDLEIEVNDLEFEILFYD